MPWLRDPVAAPPLWEGPLEPIPGETARSLPPSDSEQGLARGPTPDTEPVFDPRDLPVVQIGPPEPWPLLEVYPLSAMGPEARARIDAADYYLVRLLLSFRPLRDKVTIDWARFAVELQCGPDVHAEAVHPDVVEESVKRTRRFTLSPSFKFAEIGGEVGEAEFGIEYTSLEPVVYGVTEPYPSWDYRPTTGHQLYGDRRMHLLIRAKRGTSTCRARLHLIADVKYHHFLWRVTRHPDLDPLEVVLWGDSAEKPR